MISNLLLASAKANIRWPPYIAVINDWMKPDEITATDMPSAVEWCAVRRAVCDLQEFPLKWMTPVGLVNECAFFRDYDSKRVPVRP
jgi:hypothetical protein